MNWTDVKRELADAVGGIDRLRGRSLPFSAKKVTPPAFMIFLPTMEPHSTFGRITTLAPVSRWEVPLAVVVGLLDAESSEAHLAEYLESGPRDVVRVLESYPYTSCSDVTVSRIEPKEMTFAGGSYLGAEFRADVVG